MIKPVDLADRRRLQSPMTPLKSPNSTRRRGRPEWNSYLTDNSYSLSPAETIKKKSMFLSKHNILVDLKEEGSPRKTLVRRKTTSPRSSKTARTKHASEDIHSDSESELDPNDITALDLLETAECTITPIVQRSTKKTPNVYVARTKHRNAARTRRWSESNSIGAKPSSSTGDHQRYPSASSASSAKTHVPPMKSGASSAASSLNHSSHSHSKLHTKAANDEANEECDAEMLTIIEQLTALSTELHYFEQLSGKKSVFDDEVNQTTTISSRVRVHCALFMYV